MDSDAKILPLTTHRFYSAVRQCIRRVAVVINEICCFVVYAVSICEIAYVPSVGLMFKHLREIIYQIAQCVQKITSTPCGTARIGVQYSEFWRPRNLLFPYASTA